MESINRAKKLSLQARHKVVSQVINLFGKNIITEYDNPKYKYGYSEQLYTEILENLNSKSMQIIYGFCFGFSGEDGGFFNELHKYVDFIVD